MNRPAPFFVGEHPAMDFLNTTAAPAGERLEWLSNGSDLLDWLERSGAIDSAVASQFRAQTRALDEVAKEARSLREWLRAFVERHGGKPLSPGALKELQRLNRLLARDDLYAQVTKELDLQVERRWTSPEQLLQPIAHSIADLVCNADFRYVRQCEGPTCTLMFYDRSKTHGRRWCSMAVCGNRAKAAAHRARQRNR